jgi:arylsulfatase A-like enzyme
VASGNDLQAHKDITNPAMERAIRKFLLENRDRRRPFFLFMYWWDPHYDYIPPPPYDEMFVPRGAEKITNVEFSPLTRLGTHISKPQLQYLQGEYDGEIRTTDEALGRLWALLRELDLWDNTTIIVTADHGEEFFEHGTLGHKNNLHVETLHVPLIMKQAGQREPREETRLTSLIDLFPTVLENTGLTSDAPVMGHSLLAPELPDRTIFHTLVARWTFVEQATGKSFDDTQVWSAARQGRYKFMVAKDRAWMLYDTQADPTEQHPLGPENVALIETFGNHLREWNLSMQEIASANESGGAAELSARDRDRLKSLGYIR